MLTGFWVPISLSKAKINYVNNILLLSVPYEEVVRLHVPVNEVVVVQELQPLDHLVCNHQRGLHRELALAEIKSVLQAGPEQIHDHSVVVALDTEPVNSRNASYIR